MLAIDTTGYWRALEELGHGDELYWIRFDQPAKSGIHLSDNNFESKINDGLYRPGKKDYKIYAVGKIKRVRQLKSGRRFELTITTKHDSESTDDDIKGSLKSTFEYASVDKNWTVS